jgi:transposase-like protein
MAKDEITALRRQLAKHEKGRGKRYPADLKRRVTAYALRRRDAGASYEEIAETVGLAFETVRRWCLAATSGENLAPMLAPVEVVAAPHGGVTIISPLGYRLEGLELAEAVAALRALG